MSMNLEGRTCENLDGALWTVHERPQKGGLYHRRPASLVFQSHWKIVEVADYPSNWDQLDDASLMSLAEQRPVAERAD